LAAASTSAPQPHRSGSQFFCRSWSLFAALCCARLTLSSALSVAARGSGGSKLYIVVNFPHRILRSNLDGSDMEVLVDDVTYPLALAVDRVHHKLYFSVSDDRSDRIIRSDLDGSNREVLIEGPLAHAIAVDPTLGRLYWSDNSGYRIQSARLDGTDVQDLVSELDEPACVGLDPKAGKLYWCDQGAASEISASDAFGESDLSRLCVRLKYG
ncbi:unnamed protein product, partial [Polarella glacialis]